MNRLWRLLPVCRLWPTDDGQKVLGCCSDVFNLQVATARWASNNFHFCWSLPFHLTQSKCKFRPVTPTKNIFPTRSDVWCQTVCKRVFFFLFFPIFLARMMQRITASGVETQEHLYCNNMGKLFIKKYNRVSDLSHWWVWILPAASDAVAALDTVEVLNPR